MKLRERVAILFALVLTVAVAVSCGKNNENGAAPEAPGAGPQGTVVPTQVPATKKGLDGFWMTRCIQTRPDQSFYAEVILSGNKYNFLNVVYTDGICAGITDQVFHQTGTIVVGDVVSSQGGGLPEGTKKIDWVSDATAESRSKRYLDIFILEANDSQLRFGIGTTYSEEEAGRLKELSTTIFYRIP